MRALILIAGCLCVAGCPSTKVTPIVSSCPPIVDYSPTFLSEAADEIAVMSTANHFPRVRQMMRDYGAERKALRTCQ